MGKCSLPHLITGGYIGNDGYCKFLFSQFFWTHGMRERERGSDSIFFDLISFAVGFVLKHLKTSMGDIPIAMITLRFPTPQDEHDHGRDDHRGVTSDSTDHVDSPSNSRGLANHFHPMGHLDHNYVTKFQRVYKKSGQLG